MFASAQFDAEAAAAPHGSFEEGTETKLGVIEAVSFTAYLIDGAWVPFTTIHGPYGTTSPLVEFGGSL